MNKGDLRLLLLLSVSMLGACASKYDGLYEPACIAHAGDRIALHKGRFEWQRFTDEIRVDESGKVIEPFPDFPKTGRYELDGNRVELVTDDGVYLDDHYFAERRDSLYLLTHEEHQAFVRNERVPGCGLKRSEDGS